MATASTTWAPQLVRDAFSIVVPETYAARSIVIYTGLYRSGARMPATQSGTRPDRDRVRGPEITILPWFR